MRKMNRKIFIVLFSLFISFGFAVNITALENETSGSDADNYNENNIVYPTMTDMPPRSPEILKIMDPDPQPTMNVDDLPSQFNWCNYDGGDWSSPAKDQASCGSCWDFSALGGLEAAINIASGRPDLDIDLSEQYVLSCLGAAGSCSGGWMSEALQYIQSTDPGNTGNSINGVTIESCMPYTATDSVPCNDKCSDWDYITDPPQPDNKLWEIESWGVTSISEDSQSGWDLIKTWLITHGPVITDIYVGGWGSFWSNNNDPNDVYEQDDSGITNHGVLICGWVDDTTVVNGGYWIIKNSWGQGWGYNGFGNIAYGCNSVGTRDLSWVEAPDWPGAGDNGGGPIDVDMAVFADFEYGPTAAHLGEEIQFTDRSDGEIALYEWDFDGDGTIESTKKNPTWTYNKEGDYEVTLTVKGEFGLQSDRTYTVSVKEIWPPKAVLPKEKVGNQMDYTFDARSSYDRDGGTIVSYEWNFDDGTTAEGPYVNHEFSEADKIYDVKLTVTDNDGASESTICTVKIDKTIPPVTVISHGVGGNGNDWYGSTQRITFEATDWSEVVETFYSVDGSDWERISGNEFIAIGGEGTHTVEAYSVDYYGNEETPVSETFGIDRSIPSVDVSVAGTKEGEWYSSPPTVTIDGSDSLSGLDQITYKIDNSGWQKYSGSFSVGEGIHQIWAVAVDNAGNTVDEQVTVKVDTGAPTADCTFVGEGSNNMFYQSVKVQVYGIDPGSGVDEVYYKIDGGSFKVYTGPVTVDTIGDHTVEFYAVDNLGNEGNRETRSFSVSPVNFEMNLDQPENALYIFGVELIGLGNPVIIGPIDIMVSVEAFTTAPANLDYVEFFVDGESMMVDTEAPFIWSLDQQLFGSHTIKVDAVAGDEIVSESVQATCIIP